jgi:hypothetical protein
MRQLDLPGDPDVLADFLAGNLELPAAQKQTLLETPSVPERLSRLEMLLGDRIRTLSERLEEKRRKEISGGVLN